MFIVNQDRVLSCDIALVVDLSALISPLLCHPGKLGIPLLKNNIIDDLLDTSLLP